MKIAIAQFNPTVGAVAENSRRIQEWVGRARAERADVVLFPELCVVGYPARDLLDRPAFVKRVTAATREIVAATPAGVTVIFGSVGEAPVAGLQLTTSIGHLLKGIDQDLLPRAYGAALQFWSYPILLILAVGTYRSHQRVRRTA